MLCSFVGIGELPKCSPLPLYLADERRNTSKESPYIPPQTAINLN